VPLQRNTEPDIPERWEGLLRERFGNLFRQRASNVNRTPEVIGIGQRYSQEVAQMKCSGAALSFGEKIITVVLVGLGGFGIQARAQTSLDNSLSQQIQLSQTLDSLSRDLKRTQDQARTGTLVHTQNETLHPQAETRMLTAPSTETTAANLRRELRAERAELSRNLFNISFEGLWAVLTFEGGSPAAEWEVQEAREHGRKICELEKELETLTGETSAYERTWAAREQNLRIQALGHYAVHSSDSTVTASLHPTQLADPTTSVRKGTHTEYRIEKVPKVAGFNKDGTPYYTTGYDVVQREVPNK
jgi:hypothetical protein